MTVLASILWGSGFDFLRFLDDFLASWFTLGMLSAALAGGASPPRPPRPWACFRPLFDDFRASWLTLGMFSAALAGVGYAPQTPRS